MNIFEFVKDLIIMNDTVVVADFGGFVSNHRPAIIDEDEAKIHPPSKDITFDNLMIKDNDLLANYVSDIHTISKNEAVVLIQLFVTETKSKLKLGEKIPFEDLGYFMLDENQNIIFMQEKPVSLASEVYGMKSISINKLEETMAEETTTVEITPAAEVPEVKKPFFTRIRIFVIIGAMVLVAAITFVVLHTNFLKSSKSLVTSMFSSSDTTSLSVPVDTTSLLADNDELPADDLLVKSDTVGVAKEAENEVLNTKVEKEVKKETVKETVKETPKEKKKKEIKEKKVKTATVKSGSFYIISGSFNTIENAKKECGIWQAKGYKPEVLEKENGMYRVSVSKFTDKTKAAAETKKIKEDAANKTVWILSK